MDILSLDQSNQLLALLSEESPDLLSTLETFCEQVVEQGEPDTFLCNLFIWYGHTIEFEQPLFNEITPVVYLASILRTTPSEQAAWWSLDGPLARVSFCETLLHHIQLLHNPTQS